MFQEEKQKLDELKKLIENDIQELKIPEYKVELEDLRLKQGDPELYNDFDKMKLVNIEVKKLEDLTIPWLDLADDTDDALTLIEMANESDDESLEQEIQNARLSIEEKREKLELLRYFSGEFDNSNCYLTIHAGAGGTESCDWASMLYRMFTRFAEKKGMVCDTIEYQAGEEAGIKSATLFIQGSFAYGHLQSERGVHRLVRISPFDSNKRRHTSFCAVDVTPEVDDNIDIDINPADLRIDTFRSSGAGGQHVNTTDSAVRITHNPSGIVVSSQNQRSQHQNKDTAMKMLKAKLYQKHKEEREAEANATNAEKKKIEWGSQIRSYVFQPYQMVKDHRSNFEFSNVQAVMDGEIDGFIQAWLRM